MTQPLSLRPSWARTAPPPFHSVRWSLPYGIWTCADGREVLFDRRYCPICQRRPRSTPSLADPIEWVTFVTERNFYNDGTPEPQKKANALAALEEWDFVEPVMAQIAAARP
jgi:hypothetical protein